MSRESKPDLIVGIDFGQTCTGQSLQHVHHDGSAVANAYEQESRTVFLPTATTTYAGYRNGPVGRRQTRTRYQRSCLMVPAATVYRSGASRPRHRPNNTEMVFENGSKPILIQLACELESLPILATISRMKMSDTGTTTSLLLYITT